MIAAEITDYGNRDAWLNARTGDDVTIGASEVAVVLGRSPYKSAYTLWAEKCGLVPISKEETRRQRLGLAMEPVVAGEYTFETSRKLHDYGQYAVARSTKHRFLSATLDREIVAIDDRGPGCLDLKTAILFKAAEWGDDTPLDYQIQVQAQMAVTGYSWGSLAVLIGNHDFRWADIERNDRFINFAVERCAEFVRLVKEQTPPPIDGSKSTREALADMYPEAREATIPLPVESLEWVEQLNHAKALEAEARELRVLAENNIKAALTSASYGICPDGTKFSYRSVSRKGFVVEPTTYRQLKLEKKK